MSKILGITFTSHDSNWCYLNTETNEFFYEPFAYEINNKAGLQARYILRNISRYCNKYNIGVVDYIAICGLTYIFSLIDDTKDIFNKDGPSYKELGSNIKKIFKNNNFYDEKTCLYLIDHHVAHILASFNFIKNNAIPQIGVAIDAGGNKSGDSLLKLDTDISNLKQEVLLKNYKIGTLFNIFTETVLKKPKNVGHIMGLQSYGTSLDETIISNILNIKSQDEFKQLCNLYLNNIDISKPNNTLDKVYTIHEALKRMILNYFFNNIKPKTSVAYSGGCALNILTNTILDQNYNLTIPPAANDSGLSLGCINFILKYILNIDPNKFKPRVISKFNIKEPDDKTLKTLAKKLANNEIIAFCQGEPEIGPRALGNRSFLMNPSMKNGKDFINQEIKHRQWWRPFGGSIIDTNVIKDYKPSNLDPFMLKSFYFKSEYEDMFPAITHIDKTSRLQIVDKNENDPFYKLLYYFKEETGIPGLLNTSFNLPSFPIAGSKQTCKYTFNSIKNCHTMLLDGKIYTQ